MEYRLAEQQEWWKRLQAFFSSQKHAALATSMEKRPYISLMAYDFSDDLTCFYVATPKQSRKYEYMEYNPHVALLVDSTKNKERDFSQAMAVTALGEADVVMEKNRLTSLREHFVRRHPFLKSFLCSPQTALMEIRVGRFVVVQRFKEVLDFLL